MSNEERNAFVERRYDELRLEGKHGHYECMFRVVREIVEAELARVREELHVTNNAYAELLKELHAERERTERVARRAAELSRSFAQAAPSAFFTIDEAVAQAMREAD